MLNITLPGGRYRLNLTALLARCVYRWHAKIALGLLLLLGLTVGPRLLRGSGTLVVQAPAGSQVLLDDRAWQPGPVAAGSHTVAAVQTDGRRSWVDMQIAAGAAITVTLPEGWRAPRERALQAAGPGMQLDQIWWADGAWRVRSIPAEPEATPEPGEPALVPQTGQTVAVGPEQTERLTTLDAYGGLADQRQQGGRRLEVVYRPLDAQSGRRGYGVLELRGWQVGAATLPISAPLQQVQIAPDGRQILLVEQVGRAGSQAVLVTPEGERTPLVAVPGQLQRALWRPDGQALVLTSLRGTRLTLTFVRLGPTVAATAIAELEDTANGLVPLSWTADGVAWIVRGEDGTSTLWRAPLATLLAERVQDLALDVRALDAQPDRRMRVAVVQAGRIALGELHTDGTLIGRAALVQATASGETEGAGALVGQWQGRQLVLQRGAEAWLVDLATEDDEEGVRK